MTKQQLEKIVEAAKVDLPQKEHWTTLTGMHATVITNPSGAPDPRRIYFGVEEDSSTMVGLSRKLVNVLGGYDVPINFHWVAALEQCIQDGNFHLAERIVKMQV